MTQEEVVTKIHETIAMYERMLQELTIKKGERFDSSPFTLALQAYNKILETLKEIKS